VQSAGDSAIATHCHAAIRSARLLKTALKDKSKRERTKANIVSFGGRKQNPICNNRRNFGPKFSRSAVRRVVASRCWGCRHLAIVVTAAFGGLYGADATSGDGCAEYR
jgi:hypothetical protein